MVHILYTRIQAIEGSPAWSRYMYGLSADQQSSIQRYLRWEDRCRALFGKLLLQSQLQNFGFREDLIKEVKQTEYGRPFLDIPLDFNISHSGNYVICAASPDCRVGIDIEEWRDINYQEFRNIFTESEWERMHQIEHTIPEFFRIWAQKESVVKADGRGLTWPLDKIEANDHTIVDQDNIWYVQELDLRSGYSSWLATDKAFPQVDIAKVSF